MLQTIVYVTHFRLGKHLQCIYRTDSEWIILPGIFKNNIHAVLKAVISLGFPHQPQFEDVNLAAALYGLVASVIRDIVTLVLLEQVPCMGRVTVLQQPLGEGENSDSTVTPVISCPHFPEYLCLTVQWFIHLIITFMSAPMLCHYHSFMFHCQIIVLLPWLHSCYTGNRLPGVPALGLSHTYLVYQPWDCHVPGVWWGRHSTVAGFPSSCEDSRIWSLLWKHYICLTSQPARVEVYNM